MSEGESCCSLVNYSEVAEEVSWCLIPSLSV